MFSAKDDRGDTVIERRQQCFTGSRSTKQLSDCLEDQHVPATTGQTVCVEEADDEGGNERSDARTCQTEGGGEDEQTDVAGRVGEQRAEGREDAAQHQCQQVE